VKFRIPSKRGNQTSASAVDAFALPSASSFFDASAVSNPYAVPPAWQTWDKSAAPLQSGTSPASPYHPVGGHAAPTSFLPQVNGSPVPLHHAQAGPPTRHSIPHVAPQHLPPVGVPPALVYDFVLQQHIQRQQMAGFPGPQAHHAAMHPHPPPARSNTVGSRNSSGAASSSQRGARRGEPTAAQIPESGGKPSVSRSATGSKSVKDKDALLADQLAATEELFRKRSRKVEALKAAAEREEAAKRAQAALIAQRKKAQLEAAKTERLARESQRKAAEEEASARDATEKKRKIEEMKTRQAARAAAEAERAVAEENRARAELERRQSALSSARRRRAEEMAARGRARAAGGEEAQHTEMARSQEIESELDQEKRRLAAREKALSKAEARSQSMIKEKENRLAALEAQIALVEKKKSKLKEEGQKKAVGTSGNETETGSAQAVDTTAATVGLSSDENSDLAGASSVSMPEPAAEPVAPAEAEQEDDGESSAFPPSLHAAKKETAVKHQRRVSGHSRKATRASLAAAVSASPSVSSVSMAARHQAAAEKRAAIEAEAKAKRKREWNARRALMEQKNESDTTRAAAAARGTITSGSAAGGESDPAQAAAAEPSSSSSMLASARAAASLSAERLAALTSPASSKQKRTQVAKKVETKEGEDSSAVGALLLTPQSARRTHDVEQATADADADVATAGSSRAARKLSSAPRANEASPSTARVRQLRRSTAAAGTLLARREDRDAQRQTRSTRRTAAALAARGAATARFASASPSSRSLRGSTRAKSYLSSPRSPRGPGAQSDSWSPAIAREVASTWAFLFRNWASHLPSARAMACVRALVKARALVRDCVDFSHEELIQMDIDSWRVRKDILDTTRSYLRKVQTGFVEGKISLANPTGEAAAAGAGGTPILLYDDAGNVVNGASVRRIVGEQMTRSGSNQDEDQNSHDVAVSPTAATRGATLFSSPAMRRAAGTATSVALGSTVASVFDPLRPVSSAVSLVSPGIGYAGPLFDASGELVDLAEIAQNFLITQMEREEQAKKAKAEQEARKKIEEQARKILEEAGEIVPNSEAEQKDTALARTPRKEGRGQKNASSARGIPSAPVQLAEEPSSEEGGEVTFLTLGAPIPGIGAGSVAGPTLSAHAQQQSAVSPSGPSSQLAAARGAPSTVYPFGTAYVPPASTASSAAGATSTPATSNKVYSLSIGGGDRTRVAAAAPAAGGGGGGESPTQTNGLSAPGAVTAGGSPFGSPLQQGPDVAGLSSPVGSSKLSYSQMMAARYAKKDPAAVVDAAGAAASAHSAPQLAGAAQQQHAPIQALQLTTAAATAATRSEDFIMLPLAQPHLSSAPPTFPPTSAAPTPAQHAPAFPAAATSSTARGTKVYKLFGAKKGAAVQ
jgi:hypothetical protein